MGAPATPICRVGVDPRQSFPAPPPPHAQVGPDIRPYLSGIMVAIANHLKEGTSFPQCMEYLLHSVLHAVRPPGRQPGGPSTWHLPLAEVKLR